MKRVSTVCIVLIVLFFCLGCDQTTKAVAKMTLPQSKILSLAGGIIRLQYVENNGAFLSMGRNLPEEVRRIGFPIGLGAIIIGIMAYLFGTASLPYLNTIGLSLFAGGGLSNLIDRIFYSGKVVDFLNIGVGSFRTGIFNVADIAILAGAILIFLQRLNLRKK